MASVLKRNQRGTDHAGKINERHPLARNIGKWIGWGNARGAAVLVFHGHPRVAEDRASSDHGKQGLQKRGSDGKT